MEENKKKKRGRKPKNNIVVNNDPVFELYNDDLIVKLTNVEKEYDNMANGSEYNNGSFVKTTSELCWNCSEKLNNSIVGIPLQYINKKFYTYGDFCSLECCMRSAKENFKLNKYMNIVSYINLYNKEVFHNDNKINIAPNRLLLNRFGGPLTPTEYKNNNIDYNNYIINIPIGTQIYHSIYNNSESLQDNSNSSLRLYRTNTKSNNDINSILNL